MKLTESPVKKYASANHLKIFQPEKLKDPLFIEELQIIECRPSGGGSFPDVARNRLEYAAFRNHQSYTDLLLPQYRGAAPINWAIINGEKETGLTTFKLKQEIDTGDVCCRRLFQLAIPKSAGELHDRMKLVGAELILKTVNGMFDGNLELAPQEKILDNGSLTADHGIVLKPAPKIFTATCQIDWNKNAHNYLQPDPWTFPFTRLLLRIWVTRPSKYIGQKLK